MKQNNNGLIFGSVTAGAVFAAISIFLLSVHFGEQTKDPDKYEVLGWIAMLGMIGLSPLFGYVAVKMSDLVESESKGN